MTKILIADDEESIRRVLKLNLESKGFYVDQCALGAEVLNLVRASAPDRRPNLIVLDLGLPDINGSEVLKEIRKWSKIPIIVLTATDEESIKVALLEAGADDYITKPFSPLELIARINVALRHHKGDVSDAPIFESNGLRVDLPNKSIHLNGQPVHLTATEFSLLTVLIKNAGQVVVQEVLLREVWGANATENSHYLRIYIGALRKKLELNPSSPQHIITEPAVGYRIV